MCRMYFSTVAFRNRARLLHTCRSEPRCVMSVAELPIETFLKTQPRSVLNRLYEKPASCLAVFRYVSFAKLDFCPWWHAK